jgi:hypothetical protein
MSEAERTTTETDPRQLDLASASERAERDETEIQQIIKRSTEEALLRLPSISMVEVKRVLEARMELIKAIREIAVKLTAPEDWTLYRARDGAVLGVPTAAAAMKMRRWVGISIINHRGMNGEPMPTVRPTKNAKGEDIVLVEGLADGICGRDTMPGIYFSVRSDDQFIGRAGADTPRKGGPRQEDLMSCWRTGIDKKIVAGMTGTTKLSEAEMKTLGIDTARCVKGSGFGNASERAAGAVAEAGLPEEAEALWKEILRCKNGDVEAARTMLREITSYPAGKNKTTGQDYRAFAGIDSASNFTEIRKVKIARDKLLKHPDYRAEGEE